MSNVYAEFSTSAGFFSIEPTAMRTEEQHDFITISIRKNSCAGHLTREELVAMRDAINDYLKQENDSSATDLFYTQTHKYGEVTPAEPELELNFE